MNIQLAKIHDETIKFEVLKVIENYDVDNRIKTPQIIKAVGEKFTIAPCQIRRAVNDLRKENHKIGSDSKGYFLAKNDEELDHTKAHLYSRAMSILSALRGLKESPEKIQITLFEGI